jgi:D-alanine-D-alanine ligase
LDWSHFDPNQEVIQEYIEGQEFTVGVLQDKHRVKVLPPLEIIFANSRCPQVMGAKCKWSIQAARKYRILLSELARDVFTLLGMQDYARIDIRMRGSHPYVLDVNALPNLDPQRSYFPLAAQCAGLSYDRLVTLITSTKLGLYLGG